MVFSRASTTASVLSDKLAQIASYSAAVAVDNEEHDREYNVILKDVSKDAKKRGPLTLGGNIMRGGVDLADAIVCALCSVCPNRIIYDSHCTIESYALHIYIIYHI
jgi:hypothetical protein